MCAFYLDAISGSHLFCPVKKDALPAADVGILLCTAAAAAAALDMP